MNFKISKKKINEVMSRISRLLAVTVILPVYKGINIQVKHDGIMITVSDGTVSMREYINTELETYEYGECVVDGKLFYEIIKKMEDEMIWIRRDGNQVKMKSGKAEMKLVVFQNSEYPTIHFDYPDTKFQVNAELLRNAVEKTIFSANDQQTRPILGGLNFKVKENECILTGTDSYRLSQVRLPVSCNKEICITIPKKMLSLFPMVFMGNEELFIYFTESKALVSTENIIIQSVLLDGAYPDVDRLIPTTFETKVMIPINAFINALDRTAFCKDDGVTIVGIDLLSDEIVITSESKEIGSSIESVPFESVEGNKKVSFYCNEQYIFEALKALDDSMVYLYFNSDTKPFILKSEKDDSNIQLLLPVRHQ